MAGERRTDEDRESGKTRVTARRGAAGGREEKGNVVERRGKGQMDKREGWLSGEGVRRRAAKRYRNRKGERKRKRAAHTVHMRDRPSAYEAAGIDQPKSATTPGVLLRALLFSAQRGAAWCGAARSGAEPRRPRVHGSRESFVGGGRVEKSMLEAAGEREGGGGGREGGGGEGGMQGVPRPSPTD